MHCMSAACIFDDRGDARRYYIGRRMLRSIEDAKKAGFFVVGLDADGDQNLPKFNLSDQSIYLILGSEGKGISRLAREKCDSILSIPMQSSVESLNASVAAAVVMYWISEKRS